MRTPQEITLDTSCGRIRGLETERCLQFLGVPYAHAGRFAYAEPVGHWDGELDATANGFCCPQNRAVHEHLEHPTRRFYKNEFREGIDFRYDEDCLNLNIYTPVQAQNCPVIIYIHGGGFDSGMNCEGPFDGSAFAERGIITVFLNYRVGVLGYLTHREIRERTGRDGNFGLDDQLTAIRWVREHIADFGGDAGNITLMGQSAGAISIQYLCLNRSNAGLFERAVMLSGGGLFPGFALPRRAEETHAYWEQFMRLAGCSTLDELRTVPTEKLFDAVESIRAVRKDNLYNTMPVVDGLLLPRPVQELAADPLSVDYMLSCTSADMFAPVLAHMAARYAKQTNAYLCFFDLDAPGDRNGAFHSADLRYAFETLDGSWRPYGDRDREASRQLAGYIAGFARTGDPNGKGLPLWEPARKHALRPALCISAGGTRMGRMNYPKLLFNYLTKGDPKA
ncbi:MAG: carboxylesterase family protein [Lachnospiraceae bacterium]|nr:carboxylesterase family protein [Lachnospiraceae bacterium]